MTKSNKPAAKNTTETGRLMPTVVESNTDIGDAAFASGRKRGILAINNDGDLVVCCRATARIHGWKLEGSLHVRPSTAAVKEVKADQPARRKTDKNPKAAISAAAATLGLDDILAVK